MEYIEASNLAVEEWRSFFKASTPSNLTESEINAYGYFVKDTDLVAFFMLVPIEATAVQLKHLYMCDQLASIDILVMIEICIEAVKEKHWHQIYVFSEQETLDKLVAYLQFAPVASPFQSVVRSGTWWKLEVINTCG